MKFTVVYLLLMALFLLILNIYPVYLSQDLVFKAKQSSLQNQAAVVASSLAPLEVLTSYSVNQVMNLLEDMNITRIIVTDTSARILYDTEGSEKNVGKYALYSQITWALEGDDVFYAQFRTSAVISKAASPIMYRNNIIGTVFLYDYDTEQAALISGIQQNLRLISLIVCFMAVLVSVLAVSRELARLNRILSAIRRVRDGEYGYRIEVRGRDELSELGEEFNSLTGRLQTTEEVRQRFVSDASHELKTPLASIQLLSDSIVQNGNMDVGMIRDFVSDISDEAMRLSRLSEKLLNLTRIGGTYSPEPVRVDVRAVAENARRLLTPLAERLGIRLVFNMDEGCCVLATEDDVYQIIFNLVENAIKYNVKNGSVSVLLYEREGRVNLIVDDSGIGIPREDLPHIFDRFYRVDKARSRAAGGSGLGLSIVKDTVERYSGTVEASAREAGGTRFFVSFPLCGGAEAGGSTDG